LLVGADIVECCSVYGYVFWGCWWSVEDGVEDGVFAEGVGEEEGGYGAFVDDVQSASIMQTGPV